METSDATPMGHRGGALDLLACGDVEPNPGPHSTPDYGDRLSLAARGTHVPDVEDSSTINERDPPWDIVHLRPPSLYDYTRRQWLPRLARPALPCTFLPSLSSPMWNALLRPRLSPFHARYALEGREIHMRARLLVSLFQQRRTLLLQHASLSLLGHSFPPLLPGSPRGSQRTCVHIPEMTLAGRRVPRPRWDGPAFPLPSTVTSPPSALAVHVAAMMGALLYIQGGRGALFLRRLLDAPHPDDPSLLLFLSRGLQEILFHSPAESNLAMHRIGNSVDRPPWQPMPEGWDFVRDIHVIYTDILQGRRLPPRWVWGSSDANGQAMGLYAAPALVAGTLSDGGQVVELSAEAWCVCTVTGPQVMLMQQAIDASTLSETGWDLVMAAMAAYDAVVSFALLPEHSRPSCPLSLCDVWTSQWLALESLRLSSMPHPFAIRWAESAPLAPPPWFGINSFTPYRYKYERAAQALPTDAPFAEHAPLLSLLLCGDVEPNPGPVDRALLSSFFDWELQSRRTLVDAEASYRQRLLTLSFVRCPVGVPSPCVGVPLCVQASFGPARLSDSGVVHLCRYCGVAVASSSAVRHALSHGPLTTFVGGRPPMGEDTSRCSRPADLVVDLPRARRPQEWGGVTAYYLVEMWSPTQAPTPTIPGLWRPWKPSSRDWKKCPRLTSWTTMPRTWSLTCPHLTKSPHRRRGRDLCPSASRLICSWLWMPLWVPHRSRLTVLYPCLPALCPKCLLPPRWVWSLQARLTSRLYPWPLMVTGTKCPVLRSHPRRRPSPYEMHILGPRPVLGQECMVASMLARWEDVRNGACGLRGWRFRISIRGTNQSYGCSPPRRWGLWARGDARNALASIGSPSHVPGVERPRQRGSPAWSSYPPLGGRPLWYPLPQDLRGWMPRGPRQCLSHHHRHLLVPVLTRRSTWTLMPTVIRHQARPQHWQQLAGHRCHHPHAPRAHQVMCPAPSPVVRRLGEHVRCRVASFTCNAYM